MCIRDRHSLPHVFNDHERSAAVKIRFTPASRTCCPHFPIDIESCAKYRRITHPAGNFEGTSRCRCNSANLALRIDRIAVDRTVDMLAVEQSLGDHLAAHTIFELRSGFGIEKMLGIGATLPLEPQAPGSFCIEIGLNRKPEPTREILRALACQEMMVCLLRDRERNARRQAHALQCGNSTGLFLRTMHDA